MSTRHIIGAALLALPFVALFAGMWHRDGFVSAALTWVGAVAVAAMIVLGVQLLV